ncbi:MAG: hypothetical protein ABR541_04285 [Candidatus Dormibacteria bacterium]
MDSQAPDQSADQPQGIDLSGLHRELDLLKSRLCSCGHRGECIACKGFEVLREQSQTVVAAATQPVLMQVAQEAAIKDLMGQLGGVQGKLADDPRLQELMGEMMQRVQDDLGGPEEMERLLGMFGMPGMAPDGDGPPGAPGGRRGASPDDGPAPPRGPSQSPPGFRPG